MPQIAKTLSECTVIGGDHPAFTCGDDLACVQAKYGCFRERAHGPPLIAACEGACSIVEYIKAMLRGKSVDPIDVTGQADLINRNPDNPPHLSKVTQTLCPLPRNAPALMPDFAIQRFWLRTPSHFHLGTPAVSELT